MRSRIGIAALLFLFCIGVVTASQDDIFQVLSYGQNFIVVSSDPGTANWTASTAEKIRAQVLADLRWEARWESPLLLDVEFAPAARKAACVFKDEAGARSQILEKICVRLIPSAPYWLRTGWVRNFSGQRDFHPDQMRSIMSTGKWLSLKTLLDRRGPFADPEWQDIYEREAACLLLFLIRKHPQVLSTWRNGKFSRMNVARFAQEWKDWIESAPKLLPVAAGDAAQDLSTLQRNLARLLYVRVKDGAGKVYEADSIVELTTLDECCRKDLSRRKLVDSYDGLLQLAHSDTKKSTLAQEYLDCASRILAGQDFYDRFQSLEQRRLNEAKADLID